jgi:hypothetical protein
MNASLFGFMAISRWILSLILGLLCLGTLGAIVVLAIVLATRKRTPPPNPDLYPCPDCGRLVSRQAPACPQCGKPLQTP